LTRPRAVVSLGIEMKGGGATKVRLLAAVLAIVALLSPALVNAQSISELLLKQTQIKQRIELDKKALEQKKQEAGSLQGSIASLNDEIAYAQNKIRDTEDSAALTSQIIAGLSDSITLKEGRLRSAYISLYELTRASSTETILSSSLNNAITQAQYIQSIQGQLQQELGQLNDSRAQQEHQKALLEELNASLAATRQQLVGQRSRQSYLLSLNSEQQASYEQGLNSLQKQQMQVSAEIAAYYARFSSGAIHGGTGGYQWGGANPWVSKKGSVSWSCVGNGSTAANSTGCSQIWGHGTDSPELGYYTRNCTSYAAWKWRATFGISFSYAGHAKNWPSVARSRGYTVNKTPAVGALIVWPGLASNGTNRWGHVAYVEAVNPNGTVLVSQYNAGLDGLYSTQTKSSTWDPSFGAPEFIHR
jgi:peptidoglycan DL-endopeptidase CwlO